MAQDNVRKAKAKHQQRQATRDSTLNKQRKGTEGTRIGNQVGKAFRQKPRKNS